MNYFMETICFSCRNAYAHKCNWIRLAGSCKGCEERRKLLDSLDARYVILERAEGNRYIILSCKNFIDDIGGSINE